MDLAIELCLRQRRMVDMVQVIQWKWRGEWVGLMSRTYSIHGTPLVQDGHLVLLQAQYRTTRVTGIGPRPQQVTRLRARPGLCGSAAHVVVLMLQGKEGGAKARKIRRGERE